MKAALKAGVAAAASPDSWARLCHELETPLGVAGMAAAIQQDCLATLQGSLGLDPAHPAATILADAIEAASLMHTGIERAVAVLSDQKRRLLGSANDNLLRPVALGQLGVDAARVPLARFAPMRVKLVIEIDPELQIVTDPSAWHQVLANLYTNSMQHGFEGRSGGVITLSCSAASDPAHLRLLYRDDGRGIAASVWELQFRQRFTTGASSGSSGMGLGIIQEIVTQRLRGTIEAVPASQGAAFVIEVPRDVRQLAPLPEEAACN